VDTEREVEGFALVLVMGFFDAAAEEGGAAVLGIFFAVKSFWYPDCSGHGSSRVDLWLEWQLSTFPFPSEGQLPVIIKKALKQSGLTERK